MKSFGFRYLIFGVIILVISGFIGLWSWNTLAGLFDLPTAELKHVLAAAVGLLLLRSFLFRGRRSRRGQLHGEHREHQGY